MADAAYSTTETEVAEEPITEEVVSIEDIVSDPDHTPKQLEDAINALLEKLERGDILQTPNIQKGYIQQMRDRINVLIGHEAVYREGMEAELVVAKEKLEEMIPEEGLPKEIPKKEKHLENCFGLVEDFMSEGVEEKFHSIISRTIYGYLESYGQLTDEGFEIHRKKLSEFLKGLIKKGTEVPGAEKFGETIKGVREESEAKTKERIYKIQQEIEEKKGEIEDLNTKLTELKETRKELKPKREEEKEYTEQRDKVIRQISKVNKDISDAKKAIREKEKKLGIIEEAKLTKGAIHARVNPETLLIYIHQYFKLAEHQKRAEEAGKSKEKIEQDRLMKMPTILNEARQLASEDIERYDFEYAEKDESALRLIIRRGIKTKLVIDHLAKKTIVGMVPKEVHEKATDIFLKLKKVDLRDPKALMRWVNNLEGVLPTEWPDEKREETLKKILTISIATIENSVAKVKWHQRGLQPGHFDKLTQLKNAMRRAYEERISQRVQREVESLTSPLTQEQGVKKIMEEIENFNRDIRKARHLSEADLPEELRREFRENDWLRHSMRYVAGKGGAGLLFMGRGLWKGAKKYVPKATKKALGHSANFVKKHPKGTTGATLLAVSACMSSVPIALTLYGGYRGLKWGTGKIKRAFKPKT